VIERLKEFAKRSPSKWIIGSGWDQNRWPGQQFPTKADLDAAFPDTPVYLTRIDGHASWANSKALKLAGVTRETKNPAGGLIERNASGEPTGIFIDHASNLISKVVPSPSFDELLASLKIAINELVSLGITSVHDAGIDSEDLKRFQKLKESGELKIRVYGMFAGTGADFKSHCEKGPMKDPMLSLNAVKLFMDGALGSRGAALLEDYSDQPGHKGLLLKTPEELNEAVLTVYKCGLQVGIHAIGDRGNRLALDAIENAIQITGQNDLRPRIEHAQVLHPDDIKRFKKLNVIASMQPVHAISDMPWAEKRLGPKRILGAYAWRSLLNEGVVIASGSDFPVEEPNPLLGINAAIHRQDLTGKPKNGWYKKQIMNTMEALKSFTLSGAYASFMESQIGSLEEGKLADFIVVNKYPYFLWREDLAKMKVLETYINGVKVYTE